MYLSQAYFKLYFLGTIRNTPALFFTLIFPVLMLLITAHQWGHLREDKIQAFIVFLNYAVQTVALMHLGMGVSQEKNSPWAKYKRTLPAPLYLTVVGRLKHTLFLCCINFITISIVGIFILSTPMHFFELLYFFAIAMLGAIPMALIGMTIGYAANPESSRSIFTLLNLLLLFGSFSLPSSGIFMYISQVIPTYQWFMLSLKFINPQINITPPLVCLGGYTLLFAYLFRKVYAKQNRVVKG